MRACEPWKNASEAEFDNAMEGMEKLVMNRLYDLLVCYRTICDPAFDRGFAVPLHPKLPLSFPLGR